jgi:hypothetical protein
VGQPRHHDECGAPAEHQLVGSDQHRAGGRGRHRRHASTSIARRAVSDNRQDEIRQLLIDWVLTNHEIDPADFASLDWKLVSDGVSITIE